MSFKMKIGGLFNFNKLNKDDQDKIKERLAEKHPGLKVLDSNIKINGEELSPKLIQELEENKPVAPVIEPELVEPELELEEEAIELVSEEDKKETLEALKLHMIRTMTVKELKAEAKNMKLKGYSKLNEESLVDLLIEAGYR